MCVGVREDGVCHGCCVWRRVVTHLRSTPSTGTATAGEPAPPSSSSSSCPALETARAASFRRCTAASRASYCCGGERAAGCCCCCCWRKERLRTRDVDAAGGACPSYGVPIEEKERMAAMAEGSGRRFPCAAHCSRCVLGYGAFSLRLAMHIFSVRSKTIISVEEKIPA